MQVTYTLTEEGALTFDYQAESDADTLCNLTNHSYFNLLGHAHGSLEGQRVQVWADAITETDENSVPTGTLLPVEGTPLRFARSGGIPARPVSGASPADPGQWL